MVEKSTVEIWLKEASQPLLRDNVKSIYEKGSYTCIQLEETVEKYPTALIFRLVEPYAKAVPCEKSMPKVDTTSRICAIDLGKLGTKVFIGGTQAVRFRLIETMAGVKLSPKGKEYANTLFQLNGDIQRVVDTIKDLASYFELTEG